MLGFPSVEAVEEKVVALELKRGGSEKPAAWASGLSTLDGGSCSTVYRRADDKADYVMKVTKYNVGDPGQLLEAQASQRQEVAAMARLELAGVDGVVRVKRWTAERDDELELAMFLSHAGSCRLRGIRKLDLGPNAPEGQEYMEGMVNDVMGQLFHTLVCMHEKGGVTHNDVNRDNIMLREVRDDEGTLTSLQATLVDFGSATLADENGRSPLAATYTRGSMDPIARFAYTDMVNGEAKKATDLKQNGWLTDTYALAATCCKIYGWSVTQLTELKETSGDANPALFQVVKQVLSVKWGDRLSREELQNTPWYKSWKRTTTLSRTPDSPVIVASAGSGQPFIAPSGIPVGGQVGAAGAVGLAASSAGLAASRPIKEEPMPATYSPGITPPPLAGIQPLTGGDGNGHTASYWRRSSGSEAGDLPHRPPIGAEPDVTAEAAQEAAQASAGEGKRKSGEMPEWEKHAEPLTEHQLHMTSGNATAEEINDFIYGSGVQNRGASRSASPVGDPEMPDNGTVEATMAGATAEGPGMVPVPPTEGGGIVHRAKPKDASGPGQASVTFERGGASESPAPRRMPTRSVTARAKAQASGPAYSTRSVVASKRKAEDDAAGSGAGGGTEAAPHGRRRGGGKKRKTAENAKIDSSNVCIEARRRKKPTPHAGGKAKATMTVTASKATCRDRALKRKDRDEDGDSGDDGMRRAMGSGRSGTQAATKRSRPSARGPGRDV